MGVQLVHNHEGADALSLWLSCSRAFLHACVTPCRPGTQAPIAAARLADSTLATMSPEVTPQDKKITDGSGRFFRAEHTSL
jgi:hypothetical protein